MKLSLTAALVIAFAGLVTALVSSHSAFVLVWYACLVGVGHYLVWSKRDVSGPLLVFSFYSLLAIIMYGAHLWTNPTYYGFSGGWGVGTDDSFFYSLVAYDMPHDFPTRFALRLQDHHYGDVLAVLVSVHRRIFPGLHPLDLLFFNTFVLSFLPFVTRALYRELFGEESGERWAFVFALVAPFILANGVILMRDGLVATTLTAGLLAVMRRRWLPFFLLLVATSWLRLQNGVMLGGMGLVLGLTCSHLDGARMNWVRRDSLLRLSLMGAATLVVVLAVVQFVFHVPWWEMLYRGDFLRQTLGQSATADSGTSTFYVLSNLPLPLRVPATLLFYIGSPFLALGALKSNGLWIPRAFLTNIFALMFPLLAAWFYRGVMRIMRSRHRGAFVFMILFLVSLSLVTQASMQLRHKIPMQPMFYILAAYGAATPYAQDRSLGWAVALLVILVDLAFNVLQLAGG